MKNNKKSYLQRYKDGEYEQVWAELFHLDEQIYLEPLYSDALAVVHETMNRVKYNIELLKQRLKALNYEFVSEDEKLGRELEEYFNQQDTSAIIAKLEEAGLKLPLSLKVFYEVVGRVDFRGRHPKLSSYEPDADYENEDVEYSDPLVVWPPTDEDIAKNDYSEAWEEGLSPGVFYHLEIAPDPLHKANVSGGEAYYIVLGLKSIDYFVFGEKNYGTFVQYLRYCFEWGGFPELSHAPKSAEKELEFLTKNLLPI